MKSLQFFLLKAFARILAIYDRGKYIFPKKYLGFFLLPVIVGCATITNDARVPVTFSFSDGSNGECQIDNKRMSATIEIPSVALVRRSDDNLRLRCTTEDGREAVGSIPSTVGAKIVASALFLDFGIVDAITDKHRNYPASYVIPIKAK